MTGGLFDIDSNLNTPLADQVADGLRKSIAAGRYKTGDILPSFSEMAAMFGVSSRVTREAVHRLAAEGLVVVRPRSGCRIVADGDRVRRGRILAVLHDYQMVAYHATMLVSEVERLSVKAGYAFETAYVPIAKNGVCDVSTLEDRLRSPYSLVFSIHVVRKVERLLASCGVPYVVIGSSSNVPGAAMLLSARSHGMEDAVVARCAALGVKTAWVAGYGQSPAQSSVACALADSGVSVEWQQVPLRFGFGFMQMVETAGFDAARKRFLPGGAFPDLAVVLDDYYLRGVLAALFFMGVRVPMDLRLVGLVNDGFAPATPFTLSSLMVDARRAGAEVFSSLQAVLDGTNPPRGYFTHAHFVIGESF